MDKLSMSLEDMIKAAPPKGKGKGKGKGGGGESTGRGGAIKKQPTGKAARAAAAPYSAKPRATLSSMYEESTAKATVKPVVGLTTGSKVQVSNLDFAVTKEDLEELFNDIGKVKSVAMVKKGQAVVVYQKRADAEKALSTYDGVPLDGRALKLTLLSAAAGVAEPTARTVVVAKGGRGKGAAAAGRGGGRTVVKPAEEEEEAPTGGRGKGKGKGKGGKGKGGKGKGESKPKSMEDLDAELDSYRASAE